MNAQIDIENSQTRDVISIDVPITRYEDSKNVMFDVSHLTDQQLKLLIDAIDITMPHTDIEMFFTEDEPNIPNFGPDYEFELKNNRLIGKYTRDEWLKKRKEKNER